MHVLDNAIHVCMHAANKVLEASEDRHRQLLARRPSATSVQGMTLQQINETSAAALHTMAEAAELLGAALGPQGPEDTRDGSHGHTALKTTNSLIPITDDADAQLLTTATRAPTPTRDHSAREEGFNVAAADIAATEAVVRDDSSHGEVPLMHEQVKSRYDGEVSADEDSPASSSGDGDQVDDRRINRSKQGSEWTHVTDGEGGQQVNKSAVSLAETLESVELESSEDESSNADETSEEERPSVKGRD
jgi:hypothetical protein